MAQKLTKVAETTTLATTDTLIVVDESAQNPDGSTGALKRIPKSSTGFAFPNDITSAINTEVSNRNTAITNAINTEVSNRNTAISNAIDTEVTNRNNAIDEALSTKADAIVKTASGEIASFTDGGDDLPMKSLKVNIVPKQSGSGDPSPSNVRPISGYSEVKTTRCGKNLIDDQTAVIYSRYIQVVGTNEAYWREADDSATMVLPCKPNAVYTLSINAGSPIFARMCWADFDPTTITRGTSPRVYGAISVQPYTNITITTGATAKYLIMQTGKSLLTTRQAKVQIELGSTATAYEPYEGESKSVSLGQTVYGGVLDIVSGKMAINMVKVMLSDASWSYNASYGFITTYWSNLIKGAPSFGAVGNIYCSKYKPENYDAVTRGTTDFCIGVSTDAYGYVVVSDSRYTNASDFRSANQDTEFVFEVKNPTEIQLTPTQVKTLLGNNNIWSVSGTVEVEYRADTTLAYNELLSLIASL